MELLIKASDYIYYPATTNGDASPPESEDVEITGIEIYDADREIEFPAITAKWFNFLMNNYEDELREDALEQEHSKP